MSKNHKQDKVGGIIPTYEKFCLPQNDKRETRFDMHPKSWTLLEVHIFYVKRKEI